MRRIVILGITALALFASCKRGTEVSESELPLVLSIASDSTGTGRLVAQAGKFGPDGSIAIVGESKDVLPLARRFQTIDAVDNIDGRALRDSLPDFAGERFDVILDAFNEPYGHFIVEGNDVPERTDSLREAAVRNAIFAWDSTCVRSTATPDALLPKMRSKIVIFASSMQAEFGYRDVDALLKLCGGKGILLSPVDILLEQAYASGARDIAVWTDRATRRSGAWQSVFARKAWADARLSVITPEQALDIRTEFRNLLRQYQTSGRKMDVLIVDNYAFDLAYLESELALIRREGTEEDSAFDNMLSGNFRFLEPQQVLISATYGLLRSQRLFTHRIARPSLHYFETEESELGYSVLVEVAASYVQDTYVQIFR